MVEVALLEFKILTCQILNDTCKLIINHTRNENNSHKLLLILNTSKIKYFKVLSYIKYFKILLYITKAYMQQCQGIKIEFEVVMYMTTIRKQRTKIYRY